VTTVAQTLRAVIKTLPGDSSRSDAELLLAHALEKPRVWVYAHADEPMPAAAAKQFNLLIKRRQKGEPIAYLIGHRDFWNMQLEVTSDTLIPRPETELLVELALKRLPLDRPTRVLDLGTGSGAIAFAIANERPSATVIASDSSAAALQVAQRNAQRLGQARCEFLQSLWYSELADQRFDVIVSNPPYIADGDPHLVKGDLRFEPRAALASGRDGLDAIRTIVGQAADHLLPAGWLLIEHGFDQGEAARGLFVAARLTDVRTIRDLEDRERVTCGRLA
jgi:release factor glutamine methyltransferase